MSSWLIADAVANFMIHLIDGYFDPAKLVNSARNRNDNIIAQQLAYHYGMAAYLYGYPIVDMM
ncbi:MAG: hypothetical protein GY783_16370, partial [Gammaproteobacteria bacterium]|nr:hypothetical protein [Gammaproteobacteria bacterium]